MIQPPLHPGIWYNRNTPRIHPGIWYNPLYTPEYDTTPPLHPRENIEELRMRNVNVKCHISCRVTLIVTVHNSRSWSLSPTDQGTNNKPTEQKTQIHPFKPFSLSLKKSRSKCSSPSLFFSSSMMRHLRTLLSFLPNSLAALAEVGSCGRLLHNWWHSSTIHISPETFFWKTFKSTFCLSFWTWLQKLSLHFFSGAHFACLCILHNWWHSST